MRKINVNSRRWRVVWGIILMFIWALLAWCFIKCNGSLTVQNILNFEPENKLLSVLAMLGLFVLKSVDFVMNSGILYAANGIMFPLAVALLLNIIGAVVIITTPYFIGRAYGSLAAERLEEKYPKLQVIERLRKGNERMFALLLRMIGLPVNVVSIYLGAINLDFGMYMEGSLLGLIPSIFCFTIMGVSAGNVSSPQFIIAVVVQLTMSLVSIYICARSVKGANVHTDGKHI